MRSVLFVGLGVLGLLLAACEVAGRVPETPAGFTAEAEGTTVALRWEAVTGATRYALERKSDGDYSDLATQRETSYSDAGLESETDYTYRLTALNSVGSSAPVEAEVTTGSEGEPSTIATGLNGPLGVLVGKNGTVYAVDAGTGGETEIAPGITLGDTARVVQITADGTQSDVINLPSVSAEGFGIGGNRLAQIDDALYVSHGDWDTGMGDEPPTDTFATILKIEEGEATVLADLLAFEVEENPDGLPNDPENGVDGIHSHPYDMTVSPQGTLYVTDAGGNDLLEVDPATGDISLVTAFEQLTVDLGGGETEVQFVPTGVVVAEDGTLYVSSFYQGIVRVTPEGEVSPFTDEVGFLTDLTLGPDGNLYGTSIGEETEEGPVPDSGSVMRIDAAGAATVALEGLNTPSAIDFNDAGDAFLTVNTFGAPGSGEVVRVAGLAAAQE